MKLKNILFLMTLILISSQTFLAIYLGYDKILKNYRENEIGILKKISDNFVYNIINYPEFGATVEFFAKNIELKSKIILENKNQIKFIAEQFKKNAGVERLFITNYSNKILYKSHNEFKYEKLAAKILKNSIIQNILIEDGSVMGIYGCPVIDGKNTVGSVIALKKISDSFIDKFSVLNNADITFDSESTSLDGDNSGDLLSASVAVYRKITDLNGIPIRIVFRRDVSSLKILSYKTNRNFMIINILIGTILYFSGFAFIYRLTRSLKNIEKASENISRGHYDLNVKKSRIAEINRVIQSINSMSAELKKTQDYIIRQEKLYLAGKLAQGISHELNNPLLASLGYTQMLLEKNETGDAETKKYLQNIESNIIRARKIVKSLLTYSQKQNVCKMELKLKNIIEECILLVKFNLKKKEIIIENNIDENLKIFTDKEIFKQIIINLLLNSGDAIKTNKGLIEINARLEKNNIVVEIKDNGSGMSDNELANAFEPFFTTKYDSGGTGLGLFLCYNYIKQLEGEIEIKNNLQENETDTFKTGLTVFLTQKLQ
ncbi:MAG TPA: ATP-binding protein [bacterium]|nr:ATP-binding protein [bacterium]HPN31875.1 ATP-binding protein [bacterium]